MTEDGIWVDQRGPLEKIGPIWGIGLVGLVCIIALSAHSYYNGRSQARPAIEAFLRGLNDSDITKLYSLGTADWQARNPRSYAAALFARLHAIEGNYRDMDIQAFEYYNDKQGEFAAATCAAHFDNGPAQIEVHLERSRQPDAWLVEKIHVASDAITQHLKCRNCGEVNPELSVSCVFCGKPME